MNDGRQSITGMWVSRKDRTYNKLTITLNDYVKHLGK